MTTHQEHGPQDPDAPPSDEPIISPLPEPADQEDEDDDA